MPTFLSLPPSAVLELHQVPAGNRLDFSIPRGLFAYVYRRHNPANWQCIARNACSPYLDRTFHASEVPADYVVCFCNAAGTIVSATNITTTEATTAPAPLPVYY